MNKNVKFITWMISSLLLVAIFTGFLYSKTPLILPAVEDLPQVYTAV